MYGYIFAKICNIEIEKISKNLWKPSQISLWSQFNLIAV